MNFKSLKCSYIDCFILGILTTITALVVWNAHVRQQQFTQDQNELIISQAQSAANEITRLIGEKNQQVLQFSIDHSEEIRNLINNPDDDSADERLLEKVKARFPDAIFYTLANEQGVPILEDIEGLIGGLCIKDIQTFADAKNISDEYSYDAYIHPLSFNYHFDVMVPLLDVGMSGVFFISFKATVLVDILHKHQLPNYQLFLLHHEDNKLIEISSQGTRDNLDREIRFSEEEFTAIDFMRPVKGTLWDSVAVPDKSLLIKFKRNVFVESASEVIIFWICGLLMLQFLRREENRRSRAELALKQANDVLEMRVEERTLALHRSNAELEKFAYAASHDLQEPLRMVTSYLQLISKRYSNILDKDGETFIGYAVDGAARMKQLIDDLLEYSRINANKSNPVSVNLNQQLLEVEEDLKVSIAEGSASLTYGQLPTVQADKTQLYRVFLNLIGNALKYKGEKPVQITIQANKTPDYWEFCICDNGIGIASDKHEKIFEIFNRLHSREEYSGTGIGLATTRQIVHGHGGDIWVESTPGEGSCFYFTLPLVAIADVE